MDFISPAQFRKNSEQCTEVELNGHFWNDFLESSNLSKKRDQNIEIKIFDINDAIQNMCSGLISSMFDGHYKNENFFTTNK